MPTMHNFLAYHKENEFFRYRKMIPDKLIAFGFVQHGSDYVYETPLPCGHFAMRVIVAQTGEVSTQVTDALSGEIYALHHIPGATGGFIGSVREAYAHVLMAIDASCAEPDVFKSADALHVIQYVRETYQDELQFLWKRSPENAIFRRKDTRKWYAAMLTVRREKLKLDGNGVVEILDLRCEPEDIASLVDGKRYFPGYHMNKRHWITICLDGTVPTQEIRARIDASFVLAAKA